jgi:glycosyltransferase involved in cell wall biosynthesis
VTPTLGIALPVYNGERYLREALDALLEQSFSDFELLIADNASTDGTAAIAAEYAARDLRVRYHRNAENVGAARNFNLAFELTPGRYFKWAAHDDLLHPDFLRRCVDALERDPCAVLAYPRARRIDECGEPIGDYSPGLASDSDSCTTRLEALLQYYNCYEVFGVIRREALRKTGLIGAHASGDRVFLARLGLLGRFVEVPESLFYPRSHPDMSSELGDDVNAYVRWFSAGHGGRWTFPHWRMFGEYFRNVATAPIGLRDRVAALGVLSRVLLRRWRLLRGDLLFHVRPTLVAAGVPERLLRRSSPAPIGSGRSGT